MSSESGDRGILSGQLLGPSFDSAPAAGRSDLQAGDLDPQEPALQSLQGRTDGLRQLPHG
mgnify:CR=1 FL=1